FEDHSTSEMRFSSENGQDTVEIVNASYEFTDSQLPGRSPDERLLLRKTTRTKQVIDEIGMEAKTTEEAWPLGGPLTPKPLYSLSVEGLEARTIDGALIEVNRGLEEVQWWSIYKIGNGEHLFDTYVPLMKFSISRAVQTLRYVGFEVPPDDVSDARLKDP